MSITAEDLARLETGSSRYDMSWLPWMFGMSCGNAPQEVQVMGHNPSWLKTEGGAIQVLPAWAAVVSEVLPGLS